MKYFLRGRNTIYGGLFVRCTWLAVGMLVTKWLFDEDAAFKRYFNSCR